MSAFAAIVDELAAQHDDAATLAEVIKEAEGSRFRVDQDAPTADQAYVLRLEAADGRRLMTVIPKAKALADGNGLLRQIVTGAAGVATALLTAQGILPSEPLPEHPPSRLVLP